MAATLTKTEHALLDKLSTRPHGIALESYADGIRKYRAAYSLAAKGLVHIVQESHDRIPVRKGQGRNLYWTHVGSSMVKIRLA